jgi:hypothetical protein
LAAFLSFLHRFLAGQVAHFGFALILILPSTARPLNQATQFDVQTASLRPLTLDDEESQDRAHGDSAMAYQGQPLRLPFLVWQPLLPTLLKLHVLPFFYSPMFDLNFVFCAKNKTLTIFLLPSFSLGLYHHSFLLSETQRKNSLLLTIFSSGFTLGPPKLLRRRP